MRIRAGFVSNSSSSSFLIFGTLIGCTDGEWGDTLRDGVAHLIPDLDIETNDFYEIMDKLNKRILGKGMSCIEGQNSYYIGRSWDSIGDDETGHEFKESVKEYIRTLLGDEIANQCITWEEAWYDG